MWCRRAIVLTLGLFLIISSLGLAWLSALHIVSIIKLRGVKIPKGRLDLHTALLFNAHTGFWNIHPLYWICLNFVISSLDFFINSPEKVKKNLINKCKNQAKNSFVCIIHDCGFSFNITIIVVSRDYGDTFIIAQLMEAKTEGKRHWLFWYFSPNLNEIFFFEFFLHYQNKNVYVFIIRCLFGEFIKCDIKKGFHFFFLFLQENNLS